MFEDGTSSEVYKRDYIIETGGSNRFTTTYVVSIVGEEEKLFGYDEGLMVKGRIYDEYIAANPDVDILGESIPANYFSDEEIPVHTAVFLQDGTQIINQNCGFRIYGNFTRAKNQKSIRLTARLNYDNVNEFSYEFLPKLISDKTHTPIEAFQRLSLHNSGNDNGYGFVRTQLVGRLASEFGFPDVLIAESATVYVNGRYQGVYWLQNTFDDRYFKEKYGDYSGEMVIGEGELSLLSEENAENESESRMVREYNAFCEWAANADMRREDNWLRVCNTMDIENFVKYMAIEYYVGNIDWPHNNVKVYRYYSEDEYIENSVFDGRYRYLLYDTDYGMGLKFQGWFGMDETNQRLEELSLYNDSASLFRSLIKRDEFRDMFVNAVLCMLNESFSRENVGRVLDELNASRVDELRYMMENTTLLKDSLWESDENSMNEVQQEWNEILLYSDNRSQTIIPEFDNKWGLGYPVNVMIDMPCKGELMFGKENVGSNFAGYWLEYFPLQISCLVPEGAAIAGYYVNGEYVEGESIRFMPGQYQNAGGSIVIEPVVEIEQKESLHIAAYHTEGTGDYIVLKNEGMVSILLSEYAMSDSQKNLSKGKLPSVILEPGESFLVYGGNYIGAMEEMSMKVSFSWNSEEPIILYHNSHGVVDIK